MMERLCGQSLPLLLDGAMGTQLAEAGLEMGGQNNLAHPDQVLAVHRAYAEAGCDILTTNTLTMNRIFIESHGLAIDVREVNLAGVSLAKQAAGPGQLIFGDVSSTTRLLEPYGDLDEESAYQAFLEQAQILAEGGVDGFIVETMIDLAETLLAVRACRDAAGLPVLAALSFATLENGGRTVMGNSAAQCAQELAAAGATAVGMNCGDLDPFDCAQLVKIMREAAACPVIVQPNAGRPQLIDGRTIFEMTPDHFAAGIAQCLQAGAGLVGGCCGTTPQHIAQVKRLMEHVRK